MKLFHQHNYVMLSAYDRNKLLLADLPKSDTTVDEVEVTDVLQQCQDCHALKYSEFNGHHADTLMRAQSNNHASRPVVTKKK